MAFTKTGNGTLNPLVIGITGVGTATIDGGTDVTRASALLGQYAGSDGTITVTGAGSTLTLSSFNPLLAIGILGTGELDVLNGASVSACLADLGTSTGGNGTLTISGAGSTMLLSNDFGTSTAHYAGFLNVGHSAGAEGTLNVLAGGILNIRNTTNENQPGISIGRDGGALGTATVDGAGTQINISQTGGTDSYYGGPFVGVGGRGQGSLTVSNGAQINLTGEYGQFRVSRGNNFEEGGPPRLPLSQASILSGADVTLNMNGGSYYGAQVMVGYKSNANGKLTIDGEGSTLTIHGDNAGLLDQGRARLEVGHTGHGELILSNGADITIDAGNDKRPLFMVGNEAGAVGTASLSGAGTTLTLTTTSIAADGGGLVEVGGQIVSEGHLSIVNGAKLLNDVGSTNSAMVVGAGGSLGQTPATGTVIVDGMGNSATLLDAGQLLVIGAAWDGLGSSLPHIYFYGGGKGDVFLNAGATVRANDIAVGQGGTLGGNGTLDGNVTVDGRGHILSGSALGTLEVAGNLTLHNAILDISVAGLLAGDHDQINVAGTASIGGVFGIDMEVDPQIDFARGDRVLLVDAKNLSADLSSAMVSFTNEPVSLGWLVSKEKADLYFEALSNGAGPALVSFGSASTNGATATISYGSGSGSGGRFNAVAFGNATGLEGTAANDAFNVFGSEGATLRGLGGNDRLNGEIGDDVLQGGLGDDILKGGLGTDVLEGGGGIDAADYRGSYYAVKVNLATGAASGGDAAGDTLSSIENLFGGNADDTLTGSNGSNSLSGSTGADKLTGGLGSDRLTGGSGADRFIFNSVNDSAVGSGRDVITDFSQAAHDRIVLSGIDALPASLTDDPFTFTGNGGHDAFTNGVAGQLRYDVVGGNTIIQLDINGDAAADSEIQLAGSFTLTALDFVL